MKAKCGSCGAEHVLKDAELRAIRKCKFNCSKCGKPTVIEVNLKPDATIVMSPLPSFARTGTEGVPSGLGMRCDIGVACGHDGKRERDRWAGQRNGAKDRKG